MKVSIPRIVRARFKAAPNVVVFPGGRGNHVTGRSDDLVAFLELLLEEAKAGTTVGVTMVMVQANGVVVTGWSGKVDDCVYDTLGALGVLQREFQDQFVEGLKERQ